MKKILAMALCVPILLTTNGITTLAENLTGEVMMDEQEASIPMGGYIALPEEYEVDAVESGLRKNTYGLREMPLPDSYRTENMPSIRNQNPYGTCWAFASAALGEFVEIQKGNADSSVDFSEAQLVYFTYNSLTDPLGGTAGDSNKIADGVDMWQAGGNFKYAARTLANWSGYVDETTVPYSTVETIKENGLSEAYAYGQNVAHLQSYYEINILENPEIVKQYIIDYGAVGISYYANSSTAYSKDYNSYYQDSVTEANHAVVVVGWDDSFPKEHFAVTAPQDGAWLVRNSWGGTGESLYGYFWLSYYDSSILTSAYAFEVAAYGEEDYYDNNYQYDGAMASASLRPSGSYSEVAFANIFTASAQSVNSQTVYGEELEAISFATDKAQLEYKIEIYRNLEDTSDPKGGTLALTQSGSTLCAGMYTIPLEQKIRLREGERYSVVVSIACADPDSYNPSLLVENSSGDAGWVNCNSAAKEGQSFFSTGNSWTDIGKNYNFNVRIKAYTNNLMSDFEDDYILILNEDEIYLNINETTRLSVSFEPESALNGKTVEWSSSDETVAVVDESGTVTAVGGGRASITASTKEETAACMVYVTPQKPQNILALGEDDGSITVTWDEAEGADSYTVTRSIYGQDSFTTVEVFESSYLDTSAVPGTLYHYAVCANGCGTDGYVVSSENDSCDTTYQIHYELDGGTNARENPARYTWSGNAVKLISPSKKMASFLGWYWDDQYTKAVDKSETDGQYYFYGMDYARNLTLYARWEKIYGNMKDAAISDIEPVVYSGNANEPSIEVSYEGEILQRDIDYTVDYVDNIHAGTASVVVQGIGDFTGTATKTFTIQAKSIEDGTVAPIEAVVYDQNAHTPKVQITCNSKTLVENEDYTLQYKNHVNAGTAGILVTGQGNYTGNIWVSFTILPVELKEDMVKEITESYEYTSLPIAGKVEFDEAYSNLVEGYDYELLYEDNIQAGTAKVTIHGLGNYTGSITRTFHISGWSIDDAAVTAGKSITVLYNPKGQTPQIKLAYDGRELVYGTDFDLVYYRLEQGMRVGEAQSSVTDVGEYEIAVEGKGRFEGEKGDAAHIIVKARTLQESNLYIEQPYIKIEEDGLHGSYQLRYGATRLKENTDYRVQVTEADEQYVKAAFVGCGNYTGTFYHVFLRLDEDATVLSEDCIQIEVADQIYSGEALRPIPKVTDKKQQSILIPGTDYMVCYRNNVNVGTATVYLYGTGSYIGTMTKTFRIRPYELDSAKLDEQISISVDQTQFVYQAKEVKPQVHVTFRGNTLREGKDYTVQYPGSCNVGDYELTIAFSGNIKGEAAIAYEILPCDLKTLDIEVETLRYTASAVQPTIEQLLVRMEGRTLSSKEKSGIEIVACENNIAATDCAIAVLNGTGNYTGKRSIRFAIARKSILDQDVNVCVEGAHTNGMDSGYRVLWNGQEQEPDILLEVNEYTLVEGTDYTVWYSSNEAVGDAKIVIHGINSYVGNRTLYFHIIPMEFSRENGVSVTLLPEEMVYSGSGCCPAVEVYDKDRRLVKDEDFTIYYKNNIHSGTGEVWIYGKGNYSGKIEETFSIRSKTKEDATSIKVGAIASQRYSGLLIEPVTTLTIDGVKLVLDRDYTISYSNNMEVGNDAQVSFYGIGDYEGELATARFCIYATTIKYVLNGGVNSPNNPTIYTEFTSFAFEDPSKEDYQFEGWYTDKACTKRIKKITPGMNGNLTLYAKWGSLQGIDVSKWQGTIRWDAVKASQKGFAMIRISHGTTEDAWFETNYAGAKAANIKRGVYCFNEATTVAGAVQEAQKVLAILNGRELEYPIALDMETYGNVGNIGKDVRTQMVHAFKQVVEGAGYKFILYANLNWLNNFFVPSQLAGIDLWVARWVKDEQDYQKGTKYTGPGTVRLWQYSSTGSVSGINGNVDLDVCIRPYE